MTEKEFLELKESLEEVRSKAAECKGKVDLLLKQLQKEWKCKTLKEAIKLAAELSKEKDVMQKKIDKDFAELEGAI